MWIHLVILFSSLKNKIKQCNFSQFFKIFFTNTANHRLVTTRLPDSAMIAVFSVYSSKIPGTL